MSQQLNYDISSVEPNLDISRSRFNRRYTHKTTFNEGDLVPVFYDEVLPGDTFDLSTSIFCRTSSLKTPIMDDLYLDVQYYFVPNRLVWDKWKNFCGENTQSKWYDSTTYTIPQVTAPIGGWECGTLADYFNIPTKVDNLSISALPFRAYTMIFNTWYRSENLQDPSHFIVDSTTVAGSNGTNFLVDLAKGGHCAKACKNFDYFTGCLPSPQKGPSAVLPISGFSPLVTNENVNLFGSNLPVLKYTTSTPDTNQYMISYLHDHVDTTLRTPATSNGPSTPQSSGTLTGSNFGIDLSQISAISVNELRQLFQIQKFYEAQARNGSRYTEIVKSMFGVDSPDSRLQNPEFLGGVRIDLNINQVVQTSATDTTSPQGNVAGYSVTGDSADSFIKSFTEHGMIIGLACVRHRHSYQQGLPRAFSRKSKFDFYWPQFANLGEQAILNKEIYCQGSAVVDSDGNIIDDQVFGYQERFAEYRFRSNKISGQFRSNYSSGSLDFWHLADDYSSLPVLNDTWIQEDSNTFNRVIAVSDSNVHQFLCDFYFDCKVTRPMPLYSIPGLIDHH